MSFLTESQFNQTAAGRKQGTTYQGYKSWVTKTRRLRQAKQNLLASDPAYQATQLMQQFSGALAQKQQQQSAMAQVNANIKATQAANAAASVAAQREADQMAKRAQGYSVALAQMNHNTPDQIAQIYSDEANRLQAYGTGLTGSAAAAQQQDLGAARASLQASGADTGAPIGSYSPEEMRNTLMATGVINPGESLERQATNAKLYGGYYADAQTRQVGSIAQQYLQKKQDLQAELAAKQQETAGTRGDLYQKALAGERDAATSRIATQLTGLNLLSSIGSDKAANALKLKQLQADATQNAIDNRIAQAKLQLTSDIEAAKQQGKLLTSQGLAADGKTLLPGFYPSYDANGNMHINKVPTGATYDWQKGKLIPKPGAKGGPGTGTPKQKVDALNSVSKLGNSYIDQRLASIKRQLPNAGAQGANETDEDYQKRYKQQQQIYTRRLKQWRSDIVAGVAQRISPQLKAIGYTPAQIQQVADSLVSGSIPGRNDPYPDTGFRDVNL
jgi:hypothetical protein